MSRAASARASYGIDAPPAVGIFCVLGLGLVALGSFQPSERLRYLLLGLGVWALITGSLFVVYGLVGKYRYREIVLGMIDWTGRETVLDVGTGRGFLLVGAARKLTTGKAYGIDIWSQQDLSGNSPENCTKNIVLEGLQDRAEVRSEDARTLRFPDESFDVILSNLCLHNISGREDRDQACREIARVLKRGGVALISDFKNTRDYSKVFEAEGLSVSFGPRYWLRILAPFPLRVVKAAKATNVGAETRRAD